MCNTRHECPKCFKSYTLRKNMKAHLKYECGKEPMFQCPMCPHKAYYKYRLEVHKETHVPKALKKR